MTKQAAYNSQQNKNPFNFETFGLSKLQVLVNGRSVPHSQGMTTLSEYNYLKFYMTTLNSINSPETFNVSFNDYTRGFFVIAIDVSSDFSAGCDYDNIDENGSLRIVADFKTPLKETITIFCLGEVQETLKIDSERKPSFVKWNY